MEKIPSVSTFMESTRGNNYPPVIRDRDSEREKRLKRRSLSKWYAQRRHLMEAYYYNWLRVHAYDRQTHPWTVEVMSRWMIEQAAQAETDPRMRARRRAQLVRRWQRFTSKLSSAAAEPYNKV